MKIVIFLVLIKMHRNDQRKITLLTDKTVESPLHPGRPGKSHRKDPSHYPILKSITNAHTSKAVGILIKL